MQNQEKKEPKQNTLNSLNILFDEDFKVNGITNVLECSDKNFVAFLGDNTLSITGENLALEFVDIDKKQAHILGSIRTIKFMKGKSKLSLLKKLVK